MHLVMFGIVAFALAAVQQGLKYEYQAIFALLCMVPLSLLYYTYLMICHGLFAQGVNNPLSQGLAVFNLQKKELFFVWLGVTLGFVVVNLIGAGVLYGVDYFSFGLQSWYESFMQGFTIVFMYILIFWLRVQLWSVCLRERNHG